MRRPEEYTQDLLAAMVGTTVGFWEIALKQQGPAVVARVIAEAKAEAREELTRLAVGDCPVPDGYPPDWRDHLKKWAKGAHGDMRLNDPENCVRELLRVIDHLEARVAWLAAERDLTPLLVEAEKRGAEQGRESVVRHIQAWIDRLRHDRQEWAAWNNTRMMERCEKDAELLERVLRDYGEEGKKTA